MGNVEQGTQSLIDLVSKVYPAPVRLDDAAAALGVSDRTVRRYVEEARSCGCGLAVRSRTISIVDCILHEPPDGEDESIPDDEDLAVYMVLEELAESAAGERSRADLIRSVAGQLRTEERRVEAAIESMAAHGFIDVDKTSVRPTLMPTAAYAFTAEEVSRLLALIRTERKLGDRGKALLGAESKLVKSALQRGDTSAVDQYKSRRWVRYFQGRPRGRRGEFERHAEFIDGCIARRRRILTLYRPRCGDQQEQVVCPLGTVYYWAQDDWYLVALDPHGRVSLLRGSRIASMRETWLAFDYPDDFNLVDRFREPWGVEMSDTLYDVEIRFFDDFRVIDKVRDQVAHRPSAALTTLDDGSVVLRDKVRGLTEIAAWIRQFGASAVVLQPEALRDRMAETARRLHEKYSDDSALERLCGELSVCYSRLPGDRVDESAEPCELFLEAWRAPRRARAPKSPDPGSGREAPCAGRCLDSSGRCRALRSGGVQPARYSAQVRDSLHECP